MKLSGILLLIAFNSFFCLMCFGQISFYEDVFNGGVTGNGYNPWYYEGPGTINLNINPGSSVRKAYLFYSAIKRYNVPFVEKESTILLNAASINIKTDNLLSSYIYNSGSVSERHINLYAVDVTDLIDPSLNTYILSPPSAADPNEEVFFAEYYLIVMYESNNLNKVGLSIFLNDADAASILNYQITPSMQMDLSQDVGIALHASNMCDTIQDGSYVFINSNLLGLIGGQEDNTNIPCAGVTGSFYYEDETLFGLNNDIANQYVGGLDAIAEISQYLVNESTFNLGLNYQSNFGPNSNSINQIYLTYSTPCDTSTVSIANDTTVCLGETFQLSASGGQAYEWSSSVPTALNELSCTNCPNPIFSGETSRFYTVRIWNNDSCSVVRPVKINVRPRPLFGAITTTPSECGASTGSVSVSVASGTTSPVSFTLNDTLSQSSGLFSNLTAGSYTLSFTDGNGCVSLDTIVTVSEVNSTVAQFTVSPSYGTVPLQINLNNTSQNATDFLWSVNGTGMGAVLESYICDPSGVYTIELIAWQYDPSCAYTFSLSVSAVDRLIVPTAFTPDGDGVNDFWELPNIDVIYPENAVVVFNRWGSVVYQSEKGKYALNPWKGDYKGKPLPVGTYFFIIRVDEDEEHDLKGSVTVVR